MHVVLAAASALLLAGCMDQGGQTHQIDKLNETETIAYSLGYDIGKKISSQDTGLDAAALAQGMRDGFSNAEPQMSQEEAVKALSEFQRRMQLKQQQAQSVGSEENRALGEKFLEQNKTREGVVVTDSGLQYLIEKEGSGDSPSATDQVKVHYRGTLVTGEEFDSSYGRGQPAVFPVNRVIPGWTEALQLMKPGAKWRLYIPADLAYGDRGAGPKIGPGSTLQFEVELLEIVK